MARGGGAAPPPRWPPARWGHAAWLSGAGEMVLAGGTAASGEPLTDGVWAVGVGCSGDEIRSAERGTLRDLTLPLAPALAPTQTPTLTPTPTLTLTLALTLTLTQTPTITPPLSPGVTLTPARTPRP